MLAKSKVIVLKTLKYSESSLIIKTYSEKYGTISFLAKGIRKSGKSKKAAFFSPLNILNIDFTYKENRDLHFFKDADIHIPLYSLQSKTSKLAISLFLAEFLYKALKEEEANHDLYEFIEKSILHFNELESNFINFHLLFLIKISKFLGFEPRPIENKNQLYFNIEQGVFQDFYSHQDLCLHAELSNNLNKLLISKMEDISLIKFSYVERKEVLNSILKFYEAHFPELGKIESLYILETVFSPE